MRGKGIGYGLTWDSCLALGGSPGPEKQNRKGSDHKRWWRIRLNGSLLLKEYYLGHQEASFP